MFPGRHPINRIGIVGLGDLGAKLAVQAIAHHQEPEAFDVRQNIERPTRAIDPQLDTKSLAWPPKLMHSMQGVSRRIDTLHWCAPLDRLPRDLKVGRLVLHNSVMSQSLETQERLMECGLVKNVEIIHCLMNKQKKVIIAKESTDAKFMTEHMRSLGLSTTIMTAEEHDTVMAQSQGVFALLIMHGLRRKLDAWGAQGLLVPSAHELKQAITHRESKWTQSTIDAILSNPQLAHFVKQLDVNGET